MSEPTYTTKTYLELRAERDALKEQLEAAQREAERSEKHAEERDQVAQQFEELARLLWDHYLLPMSEEKRKYVRSVLES